MIVQQGSATESNISDRHQFSIKANGKAFKLLSSNLYSDKPLAILREIGCNAVDAHKAAEQAGIVGASKRPFKLILPSDLYPFVEITDYGIGLSDEDVRGVYTVFFSSTKDTSNDYIGALGLGSKSPFSYTDTFEVISRKDGVQNHYTCFLNEDGAPELYLLETLKDQSFENGVTVKVPVKKTDYNLFRNAAQRAYQFFDVKPVTGGGNVGFTWRDNVVTYEGTNFKVIEGLKGAWAKMGQVAYPVDLDRFQQDGFVGRYTSHYSRGFLVEFNIGDLDVNAGRESLSYDKVTIANLEKGFRSIRAEMAKDLQEKVDAMPNTYQAIRLIDKIDNRRLFDLRYRAGKVDSNLVFDFTRVSNGGLAKVAEYFVKTRGSYVTKLASLGHERVPIVPSYDEWFLLVDDPKLYVKKCVWANESENIRRAKVLIPNLAEPSKDVFKATIDKLNQLGVPWKYITDLNYTFPPKVARDLTGPTPKYTGFYHHDGDFMHHLVTKELEDLSKEELAEDYLYIRWHVNEKRVYLFDKAINPIDFTSTFWAELNKVVAKTGKPVAIVANKCWDKIPDGWEDISTCLNNLLDDSQTIKTVENVYGTWIASLIHNQKDLEPEAIKNPSLAKFIHKLLQIKITKQTLDYKTENLYEQIFGGKQTVRIAPISSIKDHLFSGPVMSKVPRNFYGMWDKATLVDSVKVLDALLEAKVIDESVVAQHLAKWK